MGARGSGLGYSVALQFGISPLNAGVQILLKLQVKRIGGLSTVPATYFSFKKMFVLLDIKWQRLLESAGIAEVRPLWRGQSSESSLLIVQGPRRVLSAQYLLVTLLSGAARSAPFRV